MEIEISNALPLVKMDLISKHIGRVLANPFSESLCFLNNYFPIKFTYKHKTERVVRERCLRVSRIVQGLEVNSIPCMTSGYNKKVIVTPDKIQGIEIMPSYILFSSYEDFLQKIDSRLISVKDVPMLWDYLKEKEEETINYSFSFYMSEKLKGVVNRCIGNDFVLKFNSYKSVKGYKAYNIKNSIVLRKNNVFLVPFRNGSLSFFFNSCFWEE